ncbi:MAG: hypothetical protein Q8K85_00215 [Hyphomicrobium sp.]|nr:hypothetical protein [Hyphomicrobium sp.]
MVPIENDVATIFISSDMSIIDHHCSVAACMFAASSCCLRHLPVTGEFDRAPAQWTSRSAMERFVHRENLAHYRRLLAEPDVADDQARHQVLVRLLADETAREAKP